MKVALVTPYSLDDAGGVGTHVLGLAQWLVDAGHEPLVVAPGRRPVLARHSVELLGRAMPLPFNGSTARLALSPLQARRALTIVEGADVIHVHEPLTLGMAHAVAARAVAPLVVTHHAHFTPGSALQQVLRRRAARLPGREAIAVSAAAADTARAATGSRPGIIPNAITLPAPMPKPEGGSVLFVGRAADPRKGYRVFRALRHALQGEARFVEITDGHSHPADVARAMSEARVLVAPNLGGESFGMVLVEALAHGCAVVASDLPAFRAVIGDEAPVRWFPPGDLDSAMAALRACLSTTPDPDLARMAARRYSWEVVGPRILERYEAAIASAGPAGHGHR